MKHPLEFFDRISVINLPDRADRRRDMKSQMASIGYGFDRPNIEFFPAVRPVDAGPFPNVGTRGCFLSHLGVLNSAVNLGIKRLAIFEDDLNFSRNFESRAMAMFLRLDSSDWSIFYGGHRTHEPIIVDDGQDLLEVDSTLVVDTAHFIVIQGDAIVLLANYLKEMLNRPAGDGAGGPMHVDGAYNWFRRQHPSMRTILAVPELGFQRASRTDIHPLRWYDKLLGVRSIVAVLRRYVIRH